jgi:hypothetical protein
MMVPMNTKKFVAVLLTTVCCCSLLSAAEGKRIGILSGILEPDGFQVSGGEVFILEGAVVHVFDLGSLKVLRRFGREGQGPGEVEITPWLANTLRVSAERAVIDSASKLVMYSRDGRLIGEEVRRPQFTQVIPWGENYAVRLRAAGGEDDQTQYATIQFLDGKTDGLRELYRQPFAGQRELLDMIPDSIHVQVYGDDLYVEKGGEGFAIDVYGPSGSKIREIRLDRERERVTRADRLLYERLLKADPMMNIQEENWERFKTRTRLRYPKYYPAIRDFVISDDRIYVQTFRAEDQETEYLILDLEGSLLGKVFLPRVREPGFTEQMMGTGVRMYTFAGGTFYYLVETAEAVELHAVKLNR